MQPFKISVFSHRKHSCSVKMLRIAQARHSPGTEHLLMAETLPSSKPDQLSGWQSPLWQVPTLGKHNIPWDRGRVGREFPLSTICIREKLQRGLTLPCLYSFFKKWHCIIVIKTSRLQSKIDGVQIPVEPLTSWVTLGKLLNLSELHISRRQVERMTIPAS